MVHIPRPSGGLAKYSGSPVRAFLRGLTSSSTAWSPSAVGEQSVLSSSVGGKATRIKKRFDELPKVWIRPDGTPATPLGAWSGGLERTSEPIQDSISDHTYTAAEAKRLSAVIAGSINEVLTTRRPGRPRNKPSKQNPTENIPVEETASGEISSSPNEELPTRPKRDRKKRGTVEASVGTIVVTVAEQSQVTPPEIALVTAKRRRKRGPKVGTDFQEHSIVTEHHSPKTPLATEILANLNKFPHCLLLTRVGQFYESYFDQAAEISQLLNIKLTEKTWSGQRVLMCGFPIMHLDKYLKILVQGHNRFVALCEEFLRFRSLGPKGGFDRRVTRIVTPGTLIDEQFLNHFENNYLLAVSRDTRQSLDSHTRPIGLAWIDVSTGEFFAKHVDFAGLRDEVVRIGPREVVLDVSLADAPADPLRQAVAEEGFFTSFITPHGQRQAPDIPLSVSAQSGSDDLSSQIEPPESPLHLPLSEVEISAVRLLTAYLHANLLEHMPRLPSPSREASAGRMQIDAHTIKSLEIKESMREGGTTGSLLSVVKRTVTSGGTRLLSRWLCSPSTSLKEINARQSLVAFFYSKPDLRADLVEILSSVDDTSRIVQKFLLGRGDVSDLQAICTTIELSSSIKNRVQLERKMESEERGTVEEDKWASIDALISRLDDLQDLIDRIRTAVVRTGSLQEIEPLGNSNDEVVQPADTFSSTGWSIRSDFTPELSSLHARLAECLTRKEGLERALQSKYDAPSLTLRSSPGQGMHVHIARAKRDSARIREDPLFISITEGSTTSTFFYQEWSQLGSEIVETSSAIFDAERAAFESLRSDVSAHENEIRRNSRILDELDITLAFGVLAEELNLTRPTLSENMTYHVFNGRHPTVELGLLNTGRVFTPNTVCFTEDSPLHIITGPNMAGKSTLLRQTALIAILAQTGSFVPAESAEIGIVDRVFTRVGAKDDLFHDRSTFMVEMLETADILKRATPRSLVIMDEVGRGTTVEDGLAIAFATVHHLLSINRCRALFATHFHELADMLGYCDEDKGEQPVYGVSFFCTDVNETEDGYFSYSHRLRPGVNRNSHGIKVAQLAGMPEPAVNIAQTALEWLRARRMATLDETRERLRSLGRSLVRQ
ncbi:hypothetical protein NM688_g1127 [Phlebia brevispora]|uniref:Uncharacterized protein n=1 Tax=Phlebia brevispora TaxID=194682 RepID=A0ACC1TC88_9APHY|nr:hypothetical protein NM688_g1127 [Phlebia brevispora]